MTHSVQVSCVGYGGRAAAGEQHALGEEGFMRGVCAAWPHEGGACPHETTPRLHPPPPASTRLRDADFDAILMTTWGELGQCCSKEQRRTLEVK